MTAPGRRGRVWPGDTRPTPTRTRTPEATPGGCTTCSALQLERTDPRLGTYTATLHRPTCPILWSPR